MKLKNYEDYTDTCMYIYSDMFMFIAIDEGNAEELGKLYMYMHVIYIYVYDLCIYVLLLIQVKLKNSEDYTAADVYPAR